MIDSAKAELLILRAMQGDDQAMGAVVQQWTPWLERSLAQWLG
ncbi:MAG: hypothetical protein QOJ65_959, partial [Fimbriimonadaceae bacterium]|nr:hypothetical protein [Fimbriimonadaceae bacterium]